MKGLLRNLICFFMEPLDSETRLFENITSCMSMIDPNWQQICKPVPKEDIERLEKTLTERFGRGIPSSYRTYLELMGKEDGGLVSLKMDDPEFWNYFKGDNMAQGAIRDLEHLDEYQVQYERNTQKLCPILPFGTFITQPLRAADGDFRPKPNALIK